MEPKGARQLKHKTKRPNPRPVWSRLKLVIGYVSLLVSFNFSEGVQRERGKGRQDYVYDQSQPLAEFLAYQPQRLYNIAKPEQD